MSVVGQRSEKVQIDLLLMCRAIKLLVWRSLRAAEITIIILSIFLFQIRYLLVD